MPKPTAERWHYNKQGVPYRDDCGCAAKGKPQCGYGSFCSCAPAACSGSLADLYTRAPCGGHTVDWPLTTNPAHFGKPCAAAVLPRSTVKQKNAAIEKQIEALEAARPERAAALKLKGFRRDSQYYLEALSRD